LKSKNFSEAGDNLALIDLDGTLADFHNGMKRMMDTLRSPGEPDYSDRYDGVPSYIQARRTLIKKTPGFWRGLDRLELGFQVVGYLQEAGFRLNVLTKCSSKNPGAWAEKIEWSVKNLPSAQYTITEEKSIVYGKVLVDDFPDYYLPWLKVRPRGLVIAVAQPWNEGEDHPNVIRYDGSNQRQVREAIDKAYQRVGTKK
jgi:hypothetical protein